MSEWIASVIYWGAAAAATLMIAVAAFSAVFGWGRHRWSFISILAAIGVLIWLAGRAVLYVLTGK